MITIRCSALPRIVQCHPSATPPAVKIDRPSGAADMGSGVHEFMRRSVAGFQAITHDEADGISEMMGLDAEELRESCGIAWHSWRAIADYFPAPACEVTLGPLTVGDITLTGTADLVSVVGDCVQILDYKSGWADGDHEQQLRGYGRLALAKYPEATRVKGTIFRTRFAETQTWEWTRAELVEWFAELADRVAKRNEIYRPSPDVCGYCPRFYECPAAAALLKTAAALVADAQNSFDIAARTPEQLAGIVEAARLVAKVAEAAVDAVRPVVMAAGGVIPLNDGRELAMVDVIRKEIDFPAGEDVIAHYAGDRWREAVSVSKGDLEAIVKETAPRGMKAKLVKAMLDDLDAAGAITLKISQQLKIRKTLEMVTEAAS